MAMILCRCDHDQDVLVEYNGSLIHSATEPQEAVVEDNQFVDFSSPDIQTKKTLETPNDPSRREVLTPGQIATLQQLTPEPLSCQAFNYLSMHKLLQQWLHQGITTLFDYQTPATCAVFWRNFLEMFTTLGPRMVVAGEPIVLTSALLKNEPASQELLDEMIATIRKRAEQGVDVIVLTNQVSGDIPPNVLCELQQEIIRQGVRFVANTAWPAECPADGILKENVAEMTNRQAKTFSKSDLQIQVQKSYALATILGLQQVLGKIAMGYRADLLLYEKSQHSDIYQLQQSWLAGEPTSEASAYYHYFWFIGVGMMTFWQWLLN